MHARGIGRFAVAASVLKRIPEDSNCKANSVPSKSQFDGLDIFNAVCAHFFQFV
jgi:hypothetical protein